LKRVKKIMEPLLIPIVGKIRATNFSGTITTDGVTANIHFREEKSDTEIETIRFRQEENKKKMEEKKEEKDKVQKENKEKEKEKQVPKQISKPTVEEYQLASRAKKGKVPEWMIVTDPGRINIATTVVFHHGELVRIPGSKKPLSFKLTSGKYYESSGVRNSTKIEFGFMLKPKDDIQRSYGIMRCREKQKMSHYEIRVVRKRY
jgi:Zn-dependent metalloprotease